MSWRLIDDKAYSAFFNMAVDEAISEAARKGLTSPTLRLYQWEVPSVSIGYFQKASDINLDYCGKKKYLFVRRCTGGRAILHNSELTYSFSSSSKTEPFTGKLRKNYLAIGNAILEALMLINLDARVVLSQEKRQRYAPYGAYQRSPFCFNVSSFGEITVNGEKIAGSAQKRYVNGFLQHGSIIIDSDMNELINVLNHECSGQDSFKIGTIRKHAPMLSVAALKEAVIEGFEKSFGIRFTSGCLTEFELNLARELEKTKYSTPEWNFRL